MRKVTEKRAPVNATADDAESLNDSDGDRRARAEEVEDEEAETRVVGLKTIQNLPEALENIFRVILRRFEQSRINRRMGKSHGHGRHGEVGARTAAAVDHECWAERDR